MRFLISSMKVLHYCSIAVFICSLYETLFQSPIWVIFVIVGYALMWGTRTQYKELEQEVADNISELQDAIQSFCRECESIGYHEMEYTIGTKTFYLTLHYYAEVRAVIGATFLGDHELLSEISNETFRVLEMACLDEDGKAIDCGFTTEDINKGL